MSAEHWKGRTRPHGTVIDRSSGRVDRGGHPADLSVRLEAHSLQLACVDERATQPRPGATVSGPKVYILWKTVFSKRLASGAPTRGGGISRSKPSCLRSCLFSGSAWRV